MLAATYLRRFPKSVYASSFRRQFASDVAARNDADTPERLARLARMLEALEPMERREVHLAMAREALLKGKVALAQFAADAAARLAKEDEPERRRAVLYGAAAAVASEDVEKGVAALASLQRASLEEEDALLLDAARAVAAEVRRMPLRPQSGSEVASEDAGAASKGLGAGRTAIARIDRLIATVGTSR
jgi:chemotaxis protein MotC